MKYPKISIIVPVYNVEQYLNQCVESIVGQTYQNLEIILVDDGSPDSCPKMCEDWANNDKRIQVIHKLNGGLSDARNAGIDVASGEYLMFVDSDDFIAANMVMDLYALLNRINADIACGGVYRYCDGKITDIYNEVIRSDEVIFSGIDQLKNMLNSRTECSACGKLYRRLLIGSHRFIKERYNEDIIFLFPLYATCSKVVYTNKRYYYYRDTIGSVTHILSDKTMHALLNQQEMEQMAIKQRIPVKDEMENYKCRTCLELAYAIQRDNARKRFPQQSDYTKRQVRSHLLYMVKHPGYTWRDLAHALIVLFRL